MLLILAIVFGSVLLDQVTKMLVLAYLQGKPSFPLWEDVLHFTFVKNPGAAFGMLSNARWVFMTASTVAIVGIFYYLIKYRPQNKLLTVSLAMIAGGGIGNMIDRVCYGYVVDFIDFTLIDFAVFNVADSFVSVGACVLIAYLLLDILKELKAGKAKAQDASEQTLETENEHDGE